MPTEIENMNENMNENIKTYRANVLHYLNVSTCWSMASLQINRLVKTPLAGVRFFKTNTHDDSSIQRAAWMGGSAAYADIVQVWYSESNREEFGTYALEHVAYGVADSIARAMCAYGIIGLKDVETVLLDIKHDLITVRASQWFPLQEIPSLLLIAYQRIISMVPTDLDAIADQGAF